MPELPDVENFRRYARKALDKKIKTLRVKQKKILEVSESTLRKHLLGNRFKGTGRHGKYLFLDISDGYKLVLHFGMTGSISYWKDEEPEHRALDLELDDGHVFSVISIRKFGEIDISKSKEELIRDKDVGPDALSVSKKAFLEILKDSRGAVKNALMDQKKIAGIGNIYADEILFQLGIYPKKKIEDIDDREELYDMMKDVLKTGIKKGGARDKMPDDYLIKIRDGLRHGRKEKCPKCSGKIKNIKVGGRSTYFCEKHQKR